MQFDSSAGNDRHAAAWDKARPDGCVFLNQALMSHTGGRKRMNKVMRKACVAVMCVVLAATAVFASAADEQALRDAALIGDMKRCKELLMSGTNPDAPDKKGNTALIYAAAIGHKRHKEIVELLLKMGAEIDYINRRNGESAITVAAQCGNLDVVKLLLEKNAKIYSLFRTFEMSDGSKASPVNALSAAARCEKNNIEMLELLYAKDKSEIACKSGPFCMLPLMWAAASGHVENLKYLLKLEDGASGINEPNGNLFHMSEYEGFTALMLAARYGTPEKVEVLLDAGADVKIKDRNGKNVLWYLTQNKKMSDKDKERLSERIFGMM